MQYLVITDFDDYDRDIHQGYEGFEDKDEAIDYARSYLNESTKDTQIISRDARVFELLREFKI